MHYIPGMRLRVPEHIEIVGMDEADMGEFAYDYVGIELELKSNYVNHKESQEFLKPRSPIGIAA